MGVKGRPRIRWIDSVNEIMQSTGLREADWEDRTIWGRKLVEAMDQRRSEMPRHVELCPHCPHIVDLVGRCRLKPYTASTT
ncbi:hypothetical protein M8J77_016764 [Diaphorina citri]|nr:hypothetical protein M8J77_016764 [Diaphorina citri]